MKLEVSGPRALFVGMFTMILFLCNAQERQQGYSLLKIHVDTVGGLTVGDVLRISEDNEICEHGIREPQSLIWDTQALPAYEPQAFEVREVTEGEPNITVYSAGENSYTYDPNTFELVLTVSVQNNGQSDAGEFLTGFYISEDMGLGPSSNQLGGYMYSPGLEAGAFATGTISFNLFYVNISPGDYYVQVVFDIWRHVSESDEEDNIYSYPNSLYFAGIQGTNLTLWATGQATNSYTYYLSTHRFLVTVSAHNNGDTDAGEFAIGFFLSPDPDITIDDILISEAFYTGLKSGYALTCFTSVDLDTMNIDPGEYYVGAILDYLDQVEESYEDENGIFFEQPFSYCPIPGEPVVSGNSRVCSGLAETYTAEAAFASTYTWTVPNGWVIDSGQGSSSILVTPSEVSGNVRVLPSNACATGYYEGSLYVKEVDAPGEASLSGNSTVCDTSIQVYSASASDAISYLWTVPSGWVIDTGQYSNTIMVRVGTNSGNVCVTPSSMCESGIQKCLAISVTPLIGEATLHGDSIVKFGTKVQYSVSASGATSYDWTVPEGSTITSGQGTSTIHMTMGDQSGTICVIPSNTCFTGDTACMNVAADLLPGPPELQGNSQLCSGGIEIFTASSMLAESFTWSVPAGWSVLSGQGNDTIEVAVGDNSGEICVSPSNNSGEGPAACLFIEVSSIPGQPGAITGETMPMVHETYSYTVDAIENADSYHWSVSGGTPLADLNNLTVVWDSTGEQQIGVRSVNECGESEQTLLDVEVIEASVHRHEMDVHDMAIYPNPTSGIITIRLQNKAKSDVFVSLTDVTGKVVYVSILELENQKKEFTLDFTHLKRGLYILNIKNSDIVEFEYILKE